VSQHRGIEVEGFATGVDLLAGAHRVELRPRLADPAAVEELFVEPDVGSLVQADPRVCVVAHGDQVVEVAVDARVLAEPRGGGFLDLEWSAHRVIESDEVVQRR